jgi:hypothetical protein
VMTAAIEIAGVRGELEVASVLAKQPRVRIEGGLLRISQAALAQAVLATPVRVERVIPGSIVFSSLWNGLTITGEARPSLGGGGRIRIEITGVKAGFFPVPGMVVAALLGAVRERLSTRPGLRLAEGTVLELDLARILEPSGLLLPPARSAHADVGFLQVEF